MRRTWGLLLGLTALSAAATATDEAQACGGCFVPVTVTESTVVTGHRMAQSISPVQSVLWDQIQYSGDPAEFSWVLPVKQGARVEVGHDAFFDALDAGTATVVQSPPEGCKMNSPGGGFGCSASDSALSAREDGGGGNGVTVVHQGTVGPYETVTLATTNPTALEEWLDANGYGLPDAVAPTVAAYVAEGFDFIALKLQPGAGVQQMQPVRVVTPGMVASLPLRMVAAGAGANVDLVLFVIGEGRYQAANFENTVVPPKLVTWDFKVDRSDFAELRVTALGKNDRRTWLTAYAIQGGLLESWFQDAPLQGGGYTLSSPDGNRFEWANTIAGAYFRQAQLNGDTTSLVDSCISQIEGLAESGALVENTCDDQGACGPLSNPNNIDAQSLICGGLDDLAVAFNGLHPRDVTLTRLEASLPVAALDTDLQLEASPDQGTVASRFQAELKANACWDGERAMVLPPGEQPKSPLPPEGLILLTLGAAGVYLASRRVQRLCADGSIAVSRTSKC